MNIRYTLLSVLRLFFHEYCMLICKQLSVKSFISPCKLSTESFQYLSLMLFPKLKRKILINEIVIRAGIAIDQCLLGK